MLNDASGPIQVRVWLAEPLLGAGVRAALCMADHLCIAESSHPSDTAAAHVVVTDWPSGLQLARRDPSPSLPSLPPHSKILVICPRAREYQVASAIRTGVHGVVRSSCTTGELIAAIRAVAQGSVYVSPEVAQRMALAGEREELTGREQEVLRLLARGQCNKLIARQLGIAVGTVKTHVKAILAKLDASSRTEAASIASEKGIVDVPEFSSRRSIWGTGDQSNERRVPAPRPSTVCESATRLSAGADVQRQGHERQPSV
jgi:DNA-binding NarL/FixJ family response regulator